MWREERAQDPWTQGDHLLAALVETVDYWGRRNTLAHQYKVRSHDLPKQIVVPRPGDQERARKKVETDPRVIAAFFAKHIGGR